MGEQISTFSERAASRLKLAIAESWHLRPFSSVTAARLLLRRKSKSAAILRPQPQRFFVRHGLLQKLEVAVRMSYVSRNKTECSRIYFISLSSILKLSQTSLGLSKRNTSSASLLLNRDSGY